jgi:hypothetical protein
MAVPASCKTTFDLFMQLELFEWDLLSEDQMHLIFVQIRNEYWHVRNLRDAKWGQAARRRYYRKIAGEKNAYSSQASKSGKYWIY